MMLVIFSGLFGITVYATLPAALSNNRAEMTQVQMLDAVRAIDRQLHDAAQPLTHEQAALVRQSLEDDRSEEHTSELQSLMRISYAVFCLKKKSKIIQ